MTSPRTLTVIMFMCCTVNALDTVPDSSDILCNFFHLFYGIFDNFDQDKEEGGTHDMLQVITKPVNLNALQKEPMLYTEESINGTVYRLNLLNVTKVPNSRFVAYHYYNFTDTREYNKPESFNPDSLANLPLERFHTHEGCWGYYEQLSPGIFEGQPVDCRHGVQGHHPSFFVTVTCDGIRIASSVPSEEPTTRVRYYLKRRGPRYPVRNVPDCNVSPCHDEQ